MDYRTYLKNCLDKDGRFGAYGSAYLTPGLIPAFEEIASTYQTIYHSSQFINKLRRVRREFQERPTPVYHCERLSEKIDNCQTYLKHEDLNHTGAHKPSHCMGEGLLAKFVRKKRPIAEIGAGQHGVTLATAAVFFGLECGAHMGGVDIVKQAPSMTRMKILGAKVVPVTHGLKTLKEAVDSVFESYAKNHKDSIYCIGPALGPHPFPLVVWNFQSVVGYEARDQFCEMMGMFPDEVCACVGGGSNSIEVLTSFLDDPVDITGVEPLGKGEHPGDRAASMRLGEKGVIHGFESIMLRDENGEPAPAHSTTSGLDRPSVGPEHTFLHNLGRAKYDTINDEEAMDVFFKLSRYEGIVPAIESAHAVTYATRRVREMRQGAVLVCLSGRGDKDTDHVIEHYGYGEQFVD